MQRDEISTGLWLGIKVLLRRIIDDNRSNDNYTECDAAQSVLSHRAGGWSRNRVSPESTQFCFDVNVGQFKMPFSAFESHQGDFLAESPSTASGGITQANCRFAETAEVNSAPFRPPHFLWPSITPLNKPTVELLPPTGTPGTKAESQFRVLDTLLTQVHINFSCLNSQSRTH